MRLRGILFLSSLLAGLLAARAGAIPLESVAVAGTAIPRDVILEIAGLRLGAPCDKSSLDEATQRLGETGLFASIAYGYAPVPGKGYKLTLTLADQALEPAMIDVPGVEEKEVWQWLVARFKRFDHQVPQVEEARSYLTRQMELYLTGRLHGQALTVSVESDLGTRKSRLIFEPAVLPRTLSVEVSGNVAVPTAELNGLLERLVLNQEYSGRQFASVVDSNLRAVYEERGLYRARFTPGAPQWTDAGIVTSVAITEGEPFQLGTVEFVGEQLPEETMRKAGNLPVGKLANWKQIQAGIWDMERVVKRTGYCNASTQPERTYDDAAHLLNLRIRVTNGPLYHFGQLLITGLSADQREKALRTWKPKPGDPYDYLYGNEFFQAFSRVVDFRTIAKFAAKPRAGVGDHVMDIELVFEGK